MSDTWVENTSAFDRVKSVALTLSEPRTAGWIASEAQVSENTARSHLTRLADLGVLTTTTTEQGTGYAPDPIYTRSQDIRELVDGRSEKELAATAADVQEELQEYRETYDSDSPEALRVSVADADCSPDAARERLEAASDWEYARYRLSLLRDALDHYDTYTTPRSASA
ncbi:transcriptional regulator [Halorientalis sp. IM1011]|uniref:DUF7342 family protein n=1 Tax=Halorientalis sp. IM1011 TaxID=1932360 RepID=UPI00097CCD6D|nr:transcriptional regulator [Halorientalis sp. IM1011]AQL42322.1 transcriptional regulator [Halorientalis sp. IM1011]